MSKTVLVVSAHSNDEVLGCGGTIAKHTKSGDKAHLIFMTNGVGSHKAKKRLNLRNNKVR